MSYKNREFGVIPRQEFGAIDGLIIETLQTFKPTDRYAVRDVLLTPEGGLQVVEREKGRATPLTREVQYREIRDRWLLSDIEIHDAIPASLGISRWFNSALEMLYASGESCMRDRRSFGNDCVSSSGNFRYCKKQPFDVSECAFSYPSLLNLLENDLDTGEFSFFVPREPTIKDQEKFEPAVMDHLLSYGYYRMYHAAEGNTGGVTFTTPNFRMIYTLCKNDLTQNATAFALDPELYMTSQGIDPEDLTYDQYIELDELQEILRIKEKLETERGREVAMSEAVHEFGDWKGIQKSTERQDESEINAASPVTWVRAKQLLTQYIEQITPKQPGTVRPAN